MRRRIQLHCGAELGLLADGDGTAVQKDTVEVDEDLGTKNDLRSVVTEERWLNDGADPYRAE